MVARTSLVSCFVNCAIELRRAAHAGLRWLDGCGCGTCVSRASLSARSDTMHVSHCDRVNLLIALLSLSDHARRAAQVVNADMVFVNAKADVTAWLTHCLDVRDGGRIAHSKVKNSHLRRARHNGAIRPSWCTA